MERKSRVVFLTIMCMMVLFTGCLFNSNVSQNDGNDRSEPNPVESENNHQNERSASMSIDERIQHMTIEQKIGQMMIVGFNDTNVNDHAIQMIEKYHVGGFILYARNIHNAQQTLQLLNDLKRRNEGNIPLFLSVDQEGGETDRLPEEFVKFPANDVIGEVNDEAFSYSIGQLLGEQVASLGFNMNYAPVLDINSNPDNPVIGNRSFGAEMEVVRDLGIQTMKGMQSRQVIPVVKHFPGHGDTSVDSHLDLPVVEKTFEEIAQFELVPFAEAVNHGADVVMVAHILMSRIDDQHPSSLSSAVITDLLRKELQFDGVVITDDMTMGGITRHYDIGEAAIKAVNAGVDMVMVAHGQSTQRYVIESLIHAVQQGVIREETIDQSVYRILALKEKYQLTNEPLDFPDLTSLNERCRQILQQYLSAEAVNKSFSPVVRFHR